MNQDGNAAPHLAESRHHVPVSVVIPCHNRPMLVVEAIESALNQTAPPQEIVCADDASTDNTWEILEEQARRSGGVVRPVRHEQGRGSAEARNTGVKNARAEWVCFLDDDDLLLPNALETLTKAAQINPWAGVVHADHWEEDNNDPATRRRSRADRILADGNPFVVLFHRNFVLNQGPLIRREWFNRVGGMNPRFPPAEDYDLWLRLSLAGCRFHYVDAPLTIYRRTPGSLSRHPINLFSSDLSVIENLIAKHPEIRGVVGRSAVRHRLLFLRLRLCHALLKDGKFDEATSRLRGVWRAGSLEPEIWRLRLRLIGRAVGSAKSQRIVKEVGHYFRSLSLRAAEETLLGHSDTNNGARTPERLR